MALAPLLPCLRLEPLAGRGIPAGEPGPLRGEIAMRNPFLFLALCLVACAAPGALQTATVAPFPEPAVFAAQPTAQTVATPK